MSPTTVGLRMQPRGQAPWRESSLITFRPENSFARGLAAQVHPESTTWVQCERAQIVVGNFESIVMGIRMSSSRRNRVARGNAGEP